MENLPTWNLTDFYASPKDPQIQKDLEEARQKTQTLSKAFEGKIQSLSQEDILSLIQTYEAIDETLSKVMSYAYLLYAENMSIEAHATFLQHMKEQVTDISKVLLFVTLELNDLSDGDLAGKTLAPYASWIKHVRAYRPYQLSKDMEKLLHDKDIASRSNWIRLYDETFAAMRFKVGEDTYPISDVLNFMSDSDPKKREEAAKGFAQGLKEKASLFALVTNTLSKDQDINAKWRQYPHSETARHLSNQVEKEVVDALVAAVKKSYPTLSHRYYKLKAQWMGKESMPYWDRNAPLSEKDQKPISWEQGRDMVLEAYERFSPTMASIGQRFFDENWIDARLTPGKDSGAFSHSTVPSVHPYILINYHGKVRDVMTLAHELGHGVHQVLANEQGHLQSSTPLTVAETASVFGEMLTFQSLKSQETDPTQRKLLVASKVEDMLNTVVRQISFFDFERQLHQKRKEGDLTLDDIGTLWMDTQRESLGPAITLTPDYQYFWSYISHFIHAPYYVYAYAFGDCLVNSLYATYAQGFEGFEGKYMDLLRAGGTKPHYELVAPFGLDTRDPGFWDRGLSMISGFIDELETL